MFLFKKKKSKYDKLTREEVVNAIVELEKRESRHEQDIIDKTAEIERLLEAGRKEKNRDIQLLYAKKINGLKEDLKSDTQRAKFLVYNIQMMKKLKTAIDDKNFFASAGDVSLGNLLSDQKALAMFLQKALNTRTAAEDTLTNAEDTFKDSEALYEPNERIYDAGKNDDALLAMFETDAQDESEGLIFGEKTKGDKKANSSSN